MTEDVVVIGSALKHGISVEDVRHAWRNGKDYPYKPSRRVHLRIGPDRSGRLVELLGEFEPDDSWLVFHAMRPPTKKLLRRALEGRQ